MATDLVGQVIDGKYRVDALVGRGGMGAVYRATQLSLERPVAIKVIREESLADESAVERFRREALAVARLRHPNVVVVHDFDVAPGLGAYIVMELLEGRSLRDELVCEARLAPDRAARIVRQACDGVQAAHAVGVIHRDLKPDNIFLAGETVKVLDFGVAKLADVEARATITLPGAFVGTPAYAAPEHCLGGDSDARSDVYALGCVLYELVTGRAPFEAPNAMALLNRHVTARPTPPSMYTAEVSPELDAVILRALEKRPERRQQTAGQLARALAAVGAAGQVPTDPIAIATPVAGAATIDELLAPVAAPNNLPHQTTRFVGREREVAGVAEALASHRLVTLTGPGGIGKTRLALEAAAHLAHGFPDGVWLVQLAAVSDGEDVAAAVAAALDVREVSGTSVAERLAAHLRLRGALVVLDNCEHVVAAAADFVGTLARACPHLRVLATSREPLGVAGELVWQVPPLGLDEEAVALFVERAGLANPRFALTRDNEGQVRRICSALDGIPLAIELAAARASVLSPKQILERLADRFRLLTGGARASTARQQTLRAAIDWSYDLLSDEERALFRRLSPFVGFTLDSAEHSALSTQHSALSTQHLVLDLVAALADKSLVLVVPDDGLGEARYRMLETIRQYAAERLAAEGEADAAFAAHRAWFEGVAASMRDEGSELPLEERLARLEVEHDNLRVALATAMRDRDASAPGLALACALSRFWNLHGHWAEGRRWLEEALAAYPDAPAPLRAEGLHELANIAERQGAVAVARELYDRALALRLEIGDRRGVAYTLHNLGVNATDRGEYERARELHARSIELFREEGDRRGLAIATNGMGVAAKSLGDADSAVACFEECLALLREMGNERGVGVVQYNLGGLALDRGDLETAERLFGEGLAVARKVTERVLEANALYGLGSVARLGGDVVRAASRYAESLADRREMGDQPGVAASLVGIAACGLATGRAREALVLAAAASALLEASGASLEPLEVVTLERVRAEALAALDARAGAEAEAEGRAIPLDRAMALALEVAGRTEV